MKRFLLLALCAVGLIGTTEATCDFGCGQGMYVSLLGGVNFLQTINEHRHFDECGRRDVKLETDAGYLIGGAFGYKINSCFRVEAEFAYRSNELDKASVRFENDFENEIENQGNHRHASGHVHTFTAMANGIFEYDLGCGFLPYVGFGVGYANNDVKVSRKKHHSENEVAELESENSNRKHDKLGGHDGRFAWQAIVGLGYQICTETEIALEYRFLDAHKDAYNHGIALNFRQYF